MPTNPKIPKAPANVFESHSIMLGQIANEVSEWCVDDECTTLDAVKLVVADARKWRGIAERHEIERKYMG